ncbi:hypothetical protein LCGC14_0400190 [marine sediment metagenome]|uniref:Uncharacterized protein n=1 Tax=marine sediment metagenome TaxID=412755 RepID=A0A0F9T2J0_9ZZZZ
MKGNNMGISIGIKEFDFPQWVTDIYNAMTPKDREVNTKANIYGICNKTDKGYKISPLIAGLSNRISVLPETKDVAVAIILADLHYPWAYLPGGLTTNYTCKHCDFKFDSSLKDPQCSSCHKFSWETKP